jgi:major membrane immunogen (membrane-anchored lipoprotein)
MKKYFLFIVIFISLLITNCSTSDDNNLDCSAVLCIEDVIRFKIVSKNTQENLFTNGTFKVEDIHVKNKVDNQELAFNFVNYNDLDIITVFTYHYVNNNENYLISISDQLEFEVKYSVKFPAKLTCCPDYTVNNFEIKSLDFEYDESNQTCTIFVED